MKKIWKYFFLLLSTSVTAQNLVPNPSFEDTVACPIGGSQINYAVGWSSYANTPDYFNSCNTGNVGVPSNQWGYQYPVEGNAYAGIISYYTQASNLREFIGIQLTQPLVIGQSYYVSFNVALAFKYSLRNGIATNKIGAKMSTMSYSSTNTAPIDNQAQVYTNSIITDTTNWTQISGSFVADSAYNYLIIGNFFTDSLTSSTVLDTSNLAWYWYSYYYVDSIMVQDNPEEIYDPSFVNLFEVFPNPASDWIEIRGSKITAVVLCDVMGRIVYFNRNFISVLRIDVSAFTKGIYFVKAEIGRSIVVQKVILI